MIVAVLLLVVATIYAMVGQAGGTAFLAIMGAAGLPAEELRPTALLLNIVAAGYATWRLAAASEIDTGLLMRVGLPALPAAFVGGLIALQATVYFILTGIILLFAAAMMLTRLATRPASPPRGFALAAAGSGVGFISGVTGVGGGIFLAPLAILCGWTTPRQAAAISAPFILANSVAGLGGALLVGQVPTRAVWLYAAAALAGAIVGTAIGRRLMSETAIRYVLAAILVVAATRLLMR